MAALQYKKTSLVEKVFALEFLKFFVLIFIMQVVYPIYMFFVDPRPHRLIYDLPLRSYRTKFYLLGKTKPIAPENNKRVMYLCNHRSWGDFVCDRPLTAYHGVYLSRALVAVALPLQCTLAGLGVGGGTETCLFFSRSGGRQKLYAKLDRCAATAHFRGLIVYPEGHRQTSHTSLKLKDGCIKYAYERGMDLQVCISANKEFVIDERGFRYGFDVPVRSAYSERIRAADSATFEAFMEAVQTAWDAQWRRAYDSSTEDADCQPWDPLANEHVASFPPPSLAFQAVRFTVMAACCCALYRAFE